MADYAVDIDLDNTNTSHVQVIDLVGTGKTVLDVGCWTGDLGRVLSTHGCKVVGVEIDPGAAATAREHLVEVVEADLDASLLSHHFEPTTFDVIVFADVLEHLKDPARVLADATGLLTPGGHIVISIPNVTHGSIRLALLQGSWRYTDTGLLDHTHIQFFSRERLLSLVAEAGLAVDELRGTVADPLAVEVSVRADELPDAVVEWVRHQPDALVYQFQLSARLAQDVVDEDRAPVELVPAAAEADVRRVDAHSERARRDRDERRRLLTVRDHIIGLQAAVTASEETAARARSRAQRLQEQLRQTRAGQQQRRQRIEQLRRRVKELEAELAAARRTIDSGVLRSVYRTLRRR